MIKQLLVAIMLMALPTIALASDDTVKQSDILKRYQSQSQTQLLKKSYDPERMVRALQSQIIDLKVERDQAFEALYQMQQKLKQNTAHALCDHADDIRKAKIEERARSLSEGIEIIHIVTEELNKNGAPVPEIIGEIEKAMKSELSDLGYEIEDTQHATEAEPEE